MNKSIRLPRWGKALLSLPFLFISFFIQAQTPEEWYTSAQERIDTLRKGSFGLKINDIDGQAYTGDIKVRLSKHEYPFGIAFDLYEDDINNGNIYTTVGAISAAEDAEIYQTERWYSFIAYAIPVEKDRNYELTLKFAEIYFDNAGSRLFDVYVEGTKYMANLDILALAGGKNIAFDTTISLTATDDVINIEYLAILDNAAPKGIEIKTVEGDWTTFINCGGGALTTLDGNTYASDEDYFDPNAARYPSEEQWMKAAMQKYFNYGVSGNSFKWSGIQPQHTTPDYTNFDHAVEWTQSIGWELRAHTLLWGGNDDHSMPGWIRQLPTPEAITDTCKMRVTREMTRYKGIIKEYDVINEPLTGHADWLRNTVGDSILWNCFKWANDADPDAELFINDYNVEYNWGQAVEYRDLILKIKEMGGPVTGVGVQAHFWDCCRPNISELVSNINIIAEAGLPIRLTEYDWGTNLTQEQQVADFIKVLTVAYSHPSITGMISWGLSDNGAWRENTGFFDASHKPKLAADTLLYYTKTKWSTNFDTTLIADQIIHFDAYYGDYIIEVNFNDTIKVFTIPCLQVNEDSVFTLNEADAMLKGPVLVEVSLSSDSTVVLSFDKSIQPESLIAGNFKLFSETPMRIQHIDRSPDDENSVIISLQTLITPDDYLSLSYFPGTLSSSDGGKALAFGPQGVPNITTGLISGSVLDDGYTIEAVFNMTVKNLSDNTSSFSIKDDGQGVNFNTIAYKENDSTRLLFSLPVALTPESLPTIRYSQGTLVGSGGMACQSSSDISVSNIWPQLINAAVSNDGTQIDALFNTPLQWVSENEAAFTIAVNDNPVVISGISESGTNSITLSFDLAEIIVAGQVVKLSYTPGTITSDIGNSLSEIDQADVQNNSTITGIESHFEDMISVIPNPAHDVVQVNWKTGFSKLIICTMEGKKLVEKAFSTNLQSTSISLDLDPGIYLLFLLNEKEIRTHRLLIN